jgi:dethiobiotin synthetase/adenosylmethionine--8-amino-7-oxononanoate aminotransferase
LVSVQENYQIFVGRSNPEQYQQLQSLIAATQPRQAQTTKRNFNSHPSINRTREDSHFYVPKETPYHQKQASAKNPSRGMRLCRSYNILLLPTRRLFSSSTKATAIASNNPDPTRHAKNHVNPITTHFVFGANTDIGKTVLTAALIRAAGAERADNTSGAIFNTNAATHYIKPLQCGGSDESFVRKHAPNHLSSATTLFEWDTPASPHFAARVEDKPVGDEEVLEALGVKLGELESVSTLESSSSSNSSIWIETAGGVLSPSSSSPKNNASHHSTSGVGGWGWVTQADLYTAFRDQASVVLIGDGRLGGISSTLTALEALLHRKYTVGGILLIRGHADGENDDSVLHDSNLQALREYAASYPSELPSGDAESCSSSLFADPERSIISLPTLPPEPEPLDEWFASSDVQDPMALFVHDHLFDSYARDRV